MATTSEQLTSVQAAITELETALADDATQEYQVGVRRWKRAEIDRTLAVLYKREEQLLKRASGGNRPQIRVAKLGRPVGSSS